MTEEAEKSQDKSWTQLIYEFTQETTFHGVRYIGKSTPFILRRLVWILLNAATAILFIYIVATRVGYFFQYPRVVNVQVLYTNNLSFPAVTICNQNTFRASAAFHLGLYDRIKTTFAGNMSWDDDSKVTYQPKRYLSGVGKSYYKLINITAEVCKHVCLAVEEFECNSFIYNTPKRTCYMTPFTRRSAGITLNYSSTLDYYEKNIAIMANTCNFDDICGFIQSNSDDTDWTLRISDPVCTETGPCYDHTSTTGAYLSLDSYAGRPQIGRITSPFVDSTRSTCAVFYYHMHGPDMGLAVLTIYSQTSGTHSSKLWSKTGDQGRRWIRAVIKLKPGLQQLVIEGRTGYGPSNMAIDDLMIMDCQTAEVTCRHSVAGQDYSGRLSTSKNGTLCEQWQLQNKNLPYMQKDKTWFPDDSLVAASSFCRNPDGKSGGPWCFVMDNETNWEYCDVPLCRNETVRLAHSAINCTFGDQDLCGYSFVPYYNDFRWLKTLPSFPNRLPVDAANNETVVPNALFISYGYGRPGQTADLVTPTLHANTIHCLQLSLAMTGSGGTIFIYLSYKDNVQKKIWEVPSGTPEDKWTNIFVQLQPGTYQIVFRSRCSRTMETSWHALSRVLAFPGDCGTTNCTQGEFRCNNGRCVANDRTCDGHDDCFDDSDEFCNKSISCRFDDAFLCGYLRTPRVTSSGLYHFSRRSYRSFDGPENVTVLEAESRVGSSGDKAEILSPMNSHNTDSCLTFMYMMTGAKPGELRVSQKFAYSQIDIFLLGENQGPSWNMASFDIQGKDYQLLFQAFNGGNGSIFLRDIELKRETCRSPENASVGCRFELSDICGYRDISNGPIRWHRAVDSKEQAYASNMWKHGGYMKIDAVRSQTSTMVSPMFNSTYQQWLYMSYRVYYVAPTDHLSVYIIRGSGGPRTLLWRVVGDQLEMWRTVQVKLPLIPDESCYFLFSASFTHREPSGYFCIDDVRILPGYSQVDAFLSPVGNVQEIANALLAIDDDQSSCFHSEITSEPLWSIQLTEVTFITQVAVDIEVSLHGSSWNINVTVQSVRGRLYICTNIVNVPGGGPSQRHLTFKCQTGVSIQKIVVRALRSDRKIILCDVKIKQRKIVYTHNLAINRPAHYLEKKVTGPINYQSTEIKSKIFYWNNCRQPFKVMSPWNIIDLGQAFEVVRLVIGYRDNCCGTQLTVILGNTVSNFSTGVVAEPTTCARVSVKQFNASHEIFCDRATKGRFVVIQMAGNGTLQPCEVQIYGLWDPKVYQPCLVGEFTCNKEKTCIPGAYVCDGMKHCLDNSDEENCTDCMLQLGIRNNNLPNSAFHASTSMDTSPPYYGRLLAPGRSWCSRPPASARRNSLSLDLGTLYRVTGVLVQGSAIIGPFVSKFTISFSLDGIRWFSFGHNNSRETFEGNVNPIGTRYIRLPRILITRFLRFNVLEYKTPGKDVVCLKVEVRGCPDNLIHGLATSKPAWQSTVGGKKGAAKKAVDGNPIAWFYAASCTHSRSEKKPWWAVDLQRQYLVVAVQITNRGDCCGKRLRNFDIRVDDKLSFNADEIQAKPLCHHQTKSPPDGATIAFLCQRPMVGQYVYIQIISRGGAFMTLCEVDVIAKVEEERNTDQLSTVTIGEDKLKKVINSKMTKNGDFGKLMIVKKDDTGIVFHDSQATCLDNAAQCSVGFTLAFWMRITHAGNATKIPIFTFTGKNSSISVETKIVQGSSPVNLLSTSVTSGMYRWTGTVDIIPVKQNHLAVSWNNQSGLNIYINGSIMAQDQLGNMTASNSAIRINDTDDEPAAVVIEDLKFWNQYQSAGYIKLVFDGYFTKSEKSTDGSSTGGSYGVGNSVALDTVLDQEAFTLSKNSSRINGVIQNLTELYYIAAHRKEDLIYRCSWNEDYCTHERFYSELTDYGLCYIFNSARNPPSNGELKSTKPGGKYGLSLTLNIEEYEYMIGPQTDAGVKIFLHEPNDIPLVRDLGFAVPPGMHSLGAVKLTQVTNMEKPFGTCATIPLHFYVNYSIPRCRRECETNQTVAACHCRNAFMPCNVTGGPPVCSVDEYFTCLNQPAAMYQKENCTNKCIEPCKRVVFEPVLSYAAISSLSAASILRDDITKLRNKVITAHTARSRVDKSIFGFEIQYFQTIVKTYDTMYKLLNTNVKNKKLSIFSKLEVAVRTFVFEVFKKDRDLRLLSPIPELNASYEKAFGIMGASLSRDTDALVSQLQNWIVFFDQVLRDMTYPASSISKIGEMWVQLKGIKDALQRYWVALENQVPAIEKLARYHGHMTLPNRILKDQREKAKCGQRKSSVQDVISYLITKLEGLEKKSRNLSIWALEMDIQKLLVVTDEAYHTLKVELPAMLKCIKEFENLLTRIQTWNDKVNLKLEAIKSGSFMTLDFDVDSNYAHLKNDRDIFQQAMNDQLLDRRSIHDLMREINLAKTNNASSYIQTFVSKVRSMLVEPSRTNLKKLEKDIVSWYNQKLTFVDNVQKYFNKNMFLAQARNLTLFKKPQINMAYPEKIKTGEADPIAKNTSLTLTQLALSAKNGVVKDLVTTFFKPLSRQIDNFDDRLQKHSRDLKTNLNMLGQLMKKQKTRENVDQQFVQKNFVNVDLFFAELSYQEIRQLRAFDNERLVSEIGGFMGLLLGASVLTMVELFDLIIYNMILKCFYRESSSKNTDSTPQRDVENGQPRNTDIYSAEYMPKRSHEVGKEYSRNQNMDNPSFI